MLNLKKSEGITINQDNKVFEDSEFSDFKFEVTIKPLKKSQWKNIKKVCMTKNGIDEIMFSSKIWMECVTNWSGIKDQDGNDIKYSEETKKLLDEDCMFFVSRVATAALNDVKESESSKKI